MDIRYQFYREEGLLIQKFIGQFELKTYLKYAGFIMSRLASERVRRVLIDFRDIEFESVDRDDEDVIKQVEEVVRIRKGAGNSSGPPEDVVHVFWVDKPLPTVVAHIFIERFPKLNYKYCSTQSKVLNVMGINPVFGDLEEKVANLTGHYN